jgi:hypothetical protein
MNEVPDSQTTAFTPADDTLAGSSATPTFSTPPESVIKLDIEHTLVEDDPRMWSNTRKVGFMFRLSK